MWARLCAHTLPYEVTEKNVNNLQICSTFYPHSPVFTYISKKTAQYQPARGKKSAPRRNVGRPLLALWKPKLTAYDSSKILLFIKIAY